jgi:hypothetical protein
MNEANPVELTILLLRILELLQKKLHIRTMGHKTKLDSKKLPGG